MVCKLNHSLFVRMLILGLSIVIITWMTSSNLVSAAQETPPQNTSASGNEQQIAQKLETQLESDMRDVWPVLFVFLVLSVVFEVALTPIFNWRIYMARFEGVGLQQK